MGNVKFDNFEWTSNKDPYWDEGHVNIELPILNPSTGQNYIALNAPLYYIQPLFTLVEFGEYQLLNPDAYALLPYGTESITFKLAFNYIDNLGQPQVWNMPGLIDLTQYTYGHWIIARYQLEKQYIDINPEGHLHTDYWTYKVCSNYDPILEALLFCSDGEDYFLPVVILMQDKHWYDEDPNSQLAITTNKILKKLTIKGEDLKASFLEQEADTTVADNYTEKWDFYLHFAVPIDAKNSDSIEYMYTFFARMLPLQSSSFEEYQEYLKSGGGVYSAGVYKWYKLPQPQNSIQITEGGITGYDATYAWSYIAEKTFPGQFLSSGIGVNTLLIPGQASVQAYDHRDNYIPQYRIGLQEMHGPDVLSAKVGNDDEYGYHDYIIFTRQFADYDPVTGELLGMYYKRILVMSLSQQYIINTRSDQGSGGDGDGPHKLQKVDISMFDPEGSYGVPVGAMRIPVHVGTLKSMPWLHREGAVAGSLTYTVFLVHKEKVKWYEKGFWKGFIIIVAIILIIVVTYIGMENLAVMLADFIVAGTATALVVFVTYLVLAFAIGTIISMAGQAIGGIWGTVFIVVASILIARGATYNLPGSWGNAVNYLNASSPYLLGGQKIYSQYVSDQLAKDWENFMLTAREKEQQLEDAWANLDVPNWLNPIYLIRDTNYYTESPGNYLSRTKDPNPGVTANKLVYNFATLARNLPENPMEQDLIQEMFIGFKQQSGAI